MKDVFGNTLTQGDVVIFYSSFYGRLRKYELTSVDKNKVVGKPITEKVDILGVKETVYGRARTMHDSCKIFRYKTSKQ